MSLPVVDVIHGRSNTHAVNDLVGLNYAGWRCWGLRSCEIGNPYQGCKENCRSKCIACHNCKQILLGKTGGLNELICFFFCFPVRYAPAWIPTNTLFVALPCFPGMMELGRKLWRETIPRVLAWLRSANRAGIEGETNILEMPRQSLGRAQRARARVERFAAP